MHPKNVVGILCEYDPFHTGHARQFSMIQKELPGAVIVCLMSGCFTQRGMPALFSPAFRARAALRAGASMVLELPCAFSVRDAENFALGAVHIFNSLACVTHLSFGVETPDLELLRQAAVILENSGAAFVASLQKSLAEGRPFAAAQAGALAAVMNDTAANTLISKPNNILAVCYLRALARLQSEILPLPVRRDSNYHSVSLSPAAHPSASAVRRVFLTGDIATAEAACGYALRRADAHIPDALDAVLLSIVRSMAPEVLKGLPDCSEGLENRLLKFAAKATSRADLLDLLKTKRYTRARLNRLLTHALLGMQARLLTEYQLPAYVRLLGFRRENERDLALLSNNRLPVIAKASDGDKNHPLYQLDERAYDLWALGAKLPAGLMYRQRIVIV